MTLRCSSRNNSSLWKDCALRNKVLSGSYKYVHILVSLRNTSFKILVARIPNPVARKKLTHFTIHNFFARSIGGSHHGVPHPRKFIAPWLLKGSNEMFVVFILAVFVRIIICLLILSFIITCFRRFPPACKTKLTQTNFNGSGSTLKLPITHLKKWKFIRALGPQSVWMLQICYKKKIVAPPAAWFKRISLISRHWVTAVHPSWLWFHGDIAYYADCFERTLNLFEHRTISDLG